MINVFLRRLLNLWKVKDWLEIDLTCHVCSLRQAALMHVARLLASASTE